MRAVSAIVESALAPAMAAVRASFSALRQIDALVEKDDRKIEELESKTQSARELREKRRREQHNLRVKLGSNLVVVHKAMGVKQGDRSGKWAAFLRDEGIDPETARRYMALAGHETSLSDQDESEVATYRDLGIDNRPRKSEEQPDNDAVTRWDPSVTPGNGNAPAEPERTGGRGKPQWLMRAIVEDYTNQNDLVCDPLAGFGSTLLAARTTSRRAVGSEIDPDIVTRSGVGELRTGDWRTALVDVGDVDAVITDPPYSARTHEASRKFGNEREDGSPLDGLGPEYAAWTRDDVFEFVRHWSPRCTGWIAALTDHNLIHDWQDAYEDVGRYSFAPVVCLIRGMTVRLCGDGPSSWALYLMVARPRSLSRWRTLPGAYVGTRDRSEAS